MNQWYKNKALLAVIAVLVVGGFFLFKGDDSSDSDNGRKAEVVRMENGEISITGKIACLPYRTEGAGQDCVKSLRGDDGKVYAFNSIGVKGAELKMAVGTDVTAVGKFEKANTSVNDSSVFKYDGVLVLSSLTKLEN